MTVPDLMEYMDRRGEKRPKNYVVRKFYRINDAWNIYIESLGLPVVCRKCYRVLKYERCRSCDNLARKCEVACGGDNELADEMMVATLLKQSAQIKKRYDQLMEFA
jgi:hypothetical protein